MNVLRKSPFKCFSVNYNQHKNFYNVFQESVVSDFLETVYARFTPDDQYKIEGYAGRRNTSN